MRVISLGFRTDLALRVLEGAQITDCGDYLVIRSPTIRTTGGATSSCSPRHPNPGRAAPGWPGSPRSSRRPGTSPSAWTRTRSRCPRNSWPPPHLNTEAEIRPLGSDADWQQSVDLAIRCFGAGDPGDYLERRAAARRRLTRAGTGAWFGAFDGGRLVAQLGLFAVGDGYARYQHVETDPAARRQGLAGTLVWAAGRYGREVLGASTLVIVAEPAGAAIRVYRACGFTARQRQLSFDRPPF